MVGLKHLLSMKQVQLPEATPEMFVKSKINPIGFPSQLRCITKPTAPSAIQQPKFQQRVEEQFSRNFQQFGDQFRNNPFAMGHGDFTMSTTMPTEFMNQMVGPSYPQQPQRFNPNPFDDAPMSNQSFYERNLKFQQQQQLNSMKRDFYNSSGMSSTGGSSTSSSSLSAYEANMQQQYSLMAPSPSFYGRFEPPKPDTPPSKPLWLDPVWHSDGNLFDNRSNGANNSGGFGNADAVKGFNFHVVSPFLSFKTMFTFDNLNNNNNV